MKITAFEIKNYKGITHARINLNGNKGSIYTLVGLNESGKTTILEAINRFRHDDKGIHAMAQKTLLSESVESLVPKKNKDNFNDDISIAAHVKMDKVEIQTLANECRQEKGFEIDVTQFPHEFKVTLKYHFKNSEHTSDTTYWNLFPFIKKAQEEQVEQEEPVEQVKQEFLKITAIDDEWQYIVNKIGELFPRIIYFPTFLFDLPERIQITEGESEIEGNAHFKLMIEDALASVSSDLKLQTHIIDRILKVEPETAFGQWMAKWMQSHEKENVEATLTKLSQKISAEIFGRWKEVLGADLGKKELLIEPIIESGDNNERIVYLSFKVKDGYTAFKISERSLGFRWFFCFLLFTRFFRGNEKGESLFLFDEPASNLHSSAQSKLLESLKDIASDRNDIIYSTHSHYLINPLWLETTFIVSNGEPTDANKIADADFGIEDANIQALPYKTFVGKHAKKGHYFQPVLDRLKVKLSPLVATRQGVFTEGKSDFYILNWYKEHHDTSLKIDFIPIGGANSGSDLMSLYLGLCLDFVFLLDGDKEGNKAKARYIKELPITENHVIQITNVFGEKIKEIESLLSADMKKAIADKFSIPKASKKHIQRAFSQALSGKNDLPPDPETLANLEKLCDELKKRLPN